jgi:hypothetical protein
MVPFDDKSPFVTREYVWNPAITTRGLVEEDKGCYRWIIDW